MDTIRFLQETEAYYKGLLDQLYNKFVDKALALGRTASKTAYANLKEEMHREYGSLGEPLLRSGFSDFSISIYSSLEKTMQACRDVTGAVDFSKGLALFLQGIALILQGNFSRATALIQLAWEEDKDLAHLGEAEKVLKESSANACKYAKFLLRDEQEYASIETSTILERLENERFRLFAIINEYVIRLKDMRSLSVKDAAETNIMRICKLTEYYLKTKVKKSYELSRLVETAFSKDKKSFPWFQEWAEWKSTPNATKYRHPSDDSKINHILDSDDNAVLKSFKLLCLLRNFTAHIYNEKSVLFDRYEESFKACLAALMYTINYVT